ncbi:hypothetical protein BGO18_00620 [Candidatus Saccharibacteria bacterium 47-87]|nr:hypothetical protein [Candidatus Saccharibacteria bacterium]OJU96684.1 MAG: hypothetical protein BGO18_00620 [Candidatus Saccharibacteria bacterium 47-87]
MIEINLIPDVKRELLRAQRARTTVISAAIVISIVAGAVVAALALYVYGVQTVRGALLDNQIKDGAAKLSKVEDLSKILTIQNQLSRISELNSQKNIDSRLFDVLAAVIPPDPNSVKVSLVTVDSEAKTVRIEGQTRGYDSMEVFKKTLDSAILNFTDNGKADTEKLATDISVSDTSYGANSDGQKVLRFVLTFTYAEKLFSPDISGATIKLDANGNVTDSYLGIPKSIFTERGTDL